MGVIGPPSLARRDLATDSLAAGQIAVGGAVCVFVCVFLCGLPACVLRELQQFVGCVYCLLCVRVPGLSLASTRSPPAHSAMRAVAARVVAAPFCRCGCDCGPLCARPTRAGLPGYRVPLRPPLASPAPPHLTRPIHPNPTHTHTHTHPQTTTQASLLFSTMTVRACLAPCCLPYPALPCPPACHPCPRLRPSGARGRVRLNPEPLAHTHTHHTCEPSRSTRSPSTPPRSVRPYAPLPARPSYP